MSNALYTAILTKFSSTSGAPAVHNALYNAIPDKLFYGVAPQGTIAPYGVMSEVSRQPINNMRDKISRIQIQFNFFSALSSASEARSLVDNCIALFDGTALTATGYGTPTLRLTPDDIQSGPVKSDEEDVALWQETITFSCILQAQA